MQEGGVVSYPIIKVMNQAVKRNMERFPPDFMFQLTDEEWKNQRSQFVTFKNDEFGDCHLSLFLRHKPFDNPLARRISYSL